MIGARVSLLFSIPILEFKVLAYNPVLERKLFDIHYVLVWIVYAHIFFHLLGSIFSIIFCDFKARWPQRIPTPPLAVLEDFFHVDNDSNIP